MLWRSYVWVRGNSDGNQARTTAAVTVTQSWLKGGCQVVCRGCSNCMPKQLKLLKLHELYLRFFKRLRRRLISESSVSWHPGQLTCWGYWLRTTLRPSRTNAEKCFFYLLLIIDRKENGLFSGYQHFLLHLNKTKLWRNNEGSLFCTKEAQLHITVNTPPIIPDNY